MKTLVLLVTVSVTILLWGLRAAPLGGDGKGNGLCEGGDGKGNGRSAGNHRDNGRSAGDTDHPRLA